MDRKHYWLLDGLRGVAAASVVALHWLDGHQIDYFGSSLLAVDFFFMLSGFVIQISYRERLHNRSDVRVFARKRVIRLYPLIGVSLLLGLLRFGISDYREGGGPAEEILQLHKVAAHVAMVPVDHSPIKSMFPINAPLWSLHFEFVAYLLFAVLLAHLGRRGLVVVAGLAAPGLYVWLTTHFGHDPATTALSEYGLGLSRACFAFVIGMLLARSHLAGRFASVSSGRRLSPVLVALPLAVFVVPTSQIPPGVALVFIGLVFPAVIVFGLGVELSPRGERVAKRAGDLSYPIYVLHVPIMWTLSGGLKAAGLFDDPVYNGIIVVPFIVVASVAALRWIDEPIRSHLSTPRPRRRSGRLADLP